MKKALKIIGMIFFWTLCICGVIGCFCVGEDMAKQIPWTLGSMALVYVSYKGIEWIDKMK